MSWPVFCLIVGLIWIFFKLPDTAKKIVGTIAAIGGVIWAFQHFQIIEKIKSGAGAIISATGPVLFSGLIFFAIHLLMAFVCGLIVGEYKHPRGAKSFLAGPFMRGVFVAIIAFCSIRLFRTTCSLFGVSLFETVTEGYEKTIFIFITIVRALLLIVSLFLLIDDVKLDCQIAKNKSGIVLRALLALFLAFVVEIVFFAPITELEVAFFGPVMFVIILVGAYGIGFLYDRKILSPVRQELMKNARYGDKSERRPLFQMDEPDEPELSSWYVSSDGNHNFGNAIRYDSGLIEIEDEDFNKIPVRQLENGWLIDNDGNLYSPGNHPPT